LCLTWYLIHNGAGSIYESNPIADAWLAAYGWLGLAFFKVLCVGMVIVISLLVALRFPRTGARLLTFACVATAAVLIYSMSLIGYFTYQEASFAARARHPVPAATTSFEPPNFAPVQPVVPPRDEHGKTVLTNPRSHHASHKPAVWLTAWPPKQELYLNPARPDSQITAGSKM